MWESNCITLVPRKILEQIGCLDESFTMPGGEYANLDLYERVASAPDVVTGQSARRGFVSSVARRHHDE